MLVSLNCPMPHSPDLSNDVVVWPVYSPQIFKTDFQIDFTEGILCLPLMLTLHLYWGSHLCRTLDVYRTLFLIGSSSLCRYFVFMVVCLHRLQP